MKKIIAASLSSFALNPAYAMINGVPENINQYPSLVQFNCSGTIIANSWVLGAGHCGEKSLVNSPKFGNLTVTKTMIHPNYNGGSGDNEDVGLWRLSDAPLLDKVIFLSNDVLHETYLHLDTVASLFDGLYFTSLGFGGTYSQLHSSSYGLLDARSWAGSHLYNQYTQWDFAALTEAEATNGDSGGPVLFNDKLIALISGGTKTSSVWPDQYIILGAAPIYQNADFILETINDWHFANDVSAQAYEQVTVELQSLHVDSIAPSWFETSDNIVLDASSSSCLSSVVSPFDICELSFETTDQYEGWINIDSNKLWVNYGTKENSTTDDDNDNDASSGSSSGSFGFAALGLLAAGLYRRRQF